MLRQTSGSLVAASLLGITERALSHSSSLASPRPLQSRIPGQFGASANLSPVFSSGNGDTTTLHRGFTAGNSSSGNGGKKVSASAAFNQQLAQAKSRRGLLSLVADPPVALSMVHVSTALSRLARLQRRPQQPPDLTAAAAFARLEPHMVEYSSMYSPRVISSILRAACKLSCLSEKAVEAVVAAATQRLQEFSSKDLLDTASGLELSRDGTGRALLGLLAEEAARRAPTFGSDHLVGILRSVAKANIPCPLLYKAAASRAAASQDAFSPKQLTMVLYSFAVGGHTCPPLFATASEVLSKEARTGGLTPQDCSLTAWACAEAGHCSPQLFEAVLKHACGHLKDFSLQDLSMLLSSCLNAGQPVGALCEAVAAAPPGQVSKWVAGAAPQSLSLMAWALAKTATPSQELFHAISREAAGKLDRFRPQNLTNLLWAHATQGYFDQALLSTAASRLVPGASGPRCGLQGFNAQNLALLAWSYGRLAFFEGDAAALIEAIRSQAVRRPAELSPTNACNLLWALAVADQLDRNTLLEVCNGAGLNGEAEQGRRIAAGGGGVLLQGHDGWCLASLFQCELAVLHREAVDLKPQEAEVLDVLPEPLNTACWQQWRSVATHTRPSRMQAEVAASLKRLGLTVSAEWLTDDGFFSVDAMVHSQRGGKAVPAVAINVDGPSHFTATAPRRALGSTILNRRLLEARVPALLSVPFWEWDRLNGSATAQVAYLKRLLRLIPDGPLSKGRSHPPPLTAVEPQGGNDSQS
mmetsp:Transcript_31181/g.88414  ORF Transcript_31181/g.88414 Transcript_31181/m.88414 type:complete len:755 (-) Transcript_31181:513-2777(-)